MASSYPGSLDSFTNPSSTDAMDASAALYHDVQHANINDAVEAVQAELGTDPAGGQATVKARLEANDWGGSMAFAYWPSGGWITNAVTVYNSSTTNATTNRLYYAPFWCPKSVTLDRIQVEVTTLQASANARLGIYASTSTNGPGALVLDGGEIDCSSTGQKTLTISQALTGGTMYWLALLNETTSVNYRRPPSEGTRPVETPQVNSEPNGGLYETVTYANGFPSSASTSPSSVPYPFLFWLRAA